MGDFLMLKWQDPLSEQIATDLKTLADHLRMIKMQGWSVIFSKNEVVVRPEDRTVGKFSITSVQDGRFSAAFFSRELNIWNKRKDFEANPSAAVRVKAWMECEVADPLKRVDE
jgi:hypothetical protein